MSGVTIQKNSAADLSGTWADISSLVLNNGDSITMGILETAGAARVGRLWVAGVLNQQPGDVANRHGAEIAGEGWIEMKLHADSVWQAVTFPTAFPYLFDDLGATQGAFAVTIGASTRTLVDLRYTVPSDAKTAGNAAVAISLRCRRA
jgi:hypothetical protein